MSGPDLEAIRERLAKHDRGYYLHRAEFHDHAREDIGRLLAIADAAAAVANADIKEAIENNLDSLDLNEMVRVADAQRHAIEHLAAVLRGEQ